MGFQSVSDSELDSFVKGANAGSFFHTSVWRSFLQRRGSRPSYHVVSQGNGSITALFPYFSEPVGRGLGVVLSSMPKSDVGGPLFAPGTPVETICRDFLRRLKWSRVLAVHSSGISEERIKTALSIGTSRVSSSRGFFLLNLSVNPTQHLWNEIFTKKHQQRKFVRRAEDLGLSAVILSLKRDYDTFYEIYGETVRGAGGNPRSFPFFTSLWSELGPDHFKVLAMKDSSGNLVGGLGFHLFPAKRSAHVIIAGYRKNVPGVEVNLVNEWHLMLWCEKNGVELINFGATPDDPNSGLYKFKRNLGATFARCFNVSNVVAPKPVYALAQRTNGIIGAMRG